MVIIDFYHWLFCSYYKWSQKINSVTYYHKYQAVLMLAFVFMINFMTLPVIYETFTGKDSVFSFLANQPKVYVVCAIVVFVLIQYVYFSYKNRYLKILKKYDSRSDSDVRKMCFYANGYAVFSSILLIGSWFFGMWFLEG